MKARILATALMAVLSQTAFADNSSYWNNVDAGMATMLETKKSAPLPSGDYWAGIQAGFDNMLSHTPYAGETTVTVARQKDYRVDRLVLGLLHARPAALEIAAAK